MTTILYVLIFLLGVLIGYFLKTWRARRGSVGTIHVIREDTRTLYSLELEDYPESLAFRKAVLFKVDTSSDESDRD
jgi:hypothetical protein